MDGMEISPAQSLPQALKRGHGVITLLCWLLQPKGGHILAFDLRTSMYVNVMGDGLLGREFSDKAGASGKAWLHGYKESSGNIIHSLIRRLDPQKLRKYLTYGLSGGKYRPTMPIVWLLSAQWLASAGAIVWPAKVLNGLFRR